MLLLMTMPHINEFMVYIVQFVLIFFAASCGDKEGVSGGRTGPNTGKQVNVYDADRLPAL